MKAISIILGLTLALTAATAEAKHSNKIRTLVGCIEGSQNHYQLFVVKKKGKARVYELVPDRDFGSEVGHKVQAHGAISHDSMKVTSLKTLAPSCS